jgi:hypothetical protein
MLRATTGAPLTRDYSKKWRRVVEWALFVVTLRVNDMSLGVHKVDTPLRR